MTSNACEPSRWRAVRLLGSVPADVVAVGVVAAAIVAVVGGSGRRSADGRRAHTIPVAAIGAVPGTAIGAGPVGGPIAAAAVCSAAYRDGTAPVAAASDGDPAAAVASSASAAPAGVGVVDGDGRGDQNRAGEDGECTAEHRAFSLLEDMASGPAERTSPWKSTAPRSSCCRDPAHG